jgi:hypothetical protein
LCNVPLELGKALTRANGSVETPLASRTKLNGVI